MEPSHNTGQIHFQIWGQYHLFPGSFPKRVVWSKLYNTIQYFPSWNSVCTYCKYNHNNTIFYANILIDIHWFKFVSNNQPPSTTETHLIIAHGIYYWKAGSNILRMYLDAHGYKIVSRHWKCPLLCCQRCLPQKYLLRQEINWSSSKWSPIFRWRHGKKNFLL